MLNHQNIQHFQAHLLGLFREKTECLNIQAVADEMHLPRPLLTAWLKTTEWELFATWLNQLRIEEAKKVLREHSDWSNDYVAQHCGFSNRQYFHKKFKELTGLTPSEWQEGKGE